MNARVLIPLIIVVFIIMPLAVAWQSDPVTPRIDALENRVATLEAWVFTPTTEFVSTPIQATPVNTPTPEIVVLMWVENDNVAQRVRACAGVTGCPIIPDAEIPPNVGFWVCLDGQLSADGYLWGRVYNVDQKQYTALLSNRGTKLVTITSERETLPANDRGCDG